MLTRKHSIEGRQPLKQAADLFAGLTPDAALNLAMLAGDILLVLDDQGRIIDSSVNKDNLSDLASLAGQDWLSTVTTESRPKVMEMLAAARKGEVQHWRQVNHLTREGDIPVKYVVLSLENDDRHLAFGRDLRDQAKLQQRLLQVQQSLERDYLKLRQLETRYRKLFDQSSEAVLIVEAVSGQVREANPAAHALMGAKAGSLAGKKLSGLFARDARDAVTAHLGAALAADHAGSIDVQPAKGKEEVSLHASGFLQHGAKHLLIRLEPKGGEKADTPSLREVIERMPDAFVIADEDMHIVEANMAFVELVEAAGVEQVVGARLGDFLGRPGIDLDLIQAQIDKDGAARNVSSFVRPRGQDDGEPVELSAVASEGPDAMFGFVIRPIARRMRELPPGPQDMPRSVDQLTDMVGRMSLKDIVRESTDLIERLCIEAALSYTADNRASAAEILGLSRQSLYSKLRRHNIGNLPPEGD